MSSALVIVNRLAPGRSAFQFGLDVCRHLRADGLACLFQLSHRSDFESLPVPLCWSTPEAGLPTEWLLPPDSGDGHVSFAEIRRFQRDCEAAAMTDGLACETLTRVAPLQDVVETSEAFFDIVCLSRDSLYEGSYPQAPLSDVLSWTTRPLLICPGTYESWRRIIIAASSERDLIELTRWAGHWSRQWNIPCEVVPPRISPRRPSRFQSRFEAWLEEWFPSLAESRAKWRECAADWNFDRRDLLLLGREATLLPLPFGHGLRLQTLARLFPGTLGILPEPHSSPAIKLLGPASEHGLLPEDEVVRERVA